MSKASSWVDHQSNRIKLFPTSTPRHLTHSTLLLPVRISSPPPTMFRHAAAAAHDGPPPLLHSSSSWSTLSPLAPPFTVDRPTTTATTTTLYPPPPLLHSSSSWSTISPLAPPFTVDRPTTTTTTLCPPPPPYAPNSSPDPRRYAPPPSAPDHVSLHRPASPPSDVVYHSRAPPEGSDRSSSASTTTTSSSSFPSMPSSRVVDAAPFYPCYAPPAGEIPWNGPFDGDDDEGRAAGADGVSSWMDPSSIFAVSAFQKGTAGEGFVDNEDSWGPWHGKLGSTARKYHFGSEFSDWLDDQNPAVHEETVRAPCNISGMSALATTAFHKGPPYFHSVDSTSIMEECNAYNSNSSYDSYITQLASCSTDAMVYYPETYSSVQAYAPLARRANSSTDCRMLTNTYPTIQSANPYKIKDDYPHDILGKRKELNIDQNAESKVGYIKRNIVSSETKTNNGNFVGTSLTTKDFLLASDLTTGNSTDCPIEVKSGFRIAQLNLPNPFPYEVNSVKPCDLMQTSSETLDHLYHAVDSPCWRGVPLPRQYPLGGEEIDYHPSVKEVYPRPLVKESNDSDDLIQHKKHTVSALNTPKQDGSLICMASSNISHLSPLREFSPVVSLPSREKKVQDAKEKLSNYGKAGNETGGQYSHVLGGQSIEALKYPKRDSEPKECCAKPLGQEGTVVSGDQPILAGETNLDTELEALARESSSNDGYRSNPGKDSLVLIKAIHGLSEILLSMYYGDANELKEHDQEVVQLVITNLKALILKSKKVIASNADISMKRDDNENIEVTNGKMYCIGPCMCSNQFDTSLNKGVAKDFGSCTGVTQVQLGVQVLEKGLEESLHEQENPQILLYKNLWIEAEAALCSLKYSRLKLELENQKKTTAIFSDSSEVAKKINPHVEKPQETNTSKPSEVDASIIARFRVLKVRDEKLCSTSIEDQEEHAVETSQLELDRNTGPEVLPAKLADLGFTEGNPRTYTEPEPIDSDILVKLSYDSQHLGANISKETGPPLMNSGYATRGSQIWTANGKGNHALLGGYDSPSSEWEHVFKDEFTWYNST